MVQPVDLVDEGKVEVEALYLHIGVTDPDVVAAVKEYESGQARNNFIELALKIGVLAMRSAKGAIDGEAIKSSGEKLISQMTERLQGHRDLLDQSMIGTLKTYFDPASGHFASRVLALTSDDGELAQLVRRQVGSQSEKLKDLLESFVGANGELTKLLAPGQGNAFVDELQTTLQKTLVDERDVVLSQFSLDVESSALSRLVKELRQNNGDIAMALTSRMQDVIGEFSLDKPDSALSRLVGRVEAAQKNVTEQFTLDRPESALSKILSEVNSSLSVGQKSQEVFQEKIIQLVSSLQAQRKAEAKSTTHGHAFEANVGLVVEEIANRQGDIFEATGSTTGTIRACKVGDFVVTLGPDNVASGAKIVIEAKEDASYNLKSTLAEADEARRNRSAGVCLFVHSTKTCQDGHEPLSRYGNDIVVSWDCEDRNSDITLKAGMMLAKAMSVRKAQSSNKDASSWTAIDRAIEQIRKQIGFLAEMRTTNETIENGARKTLERIRIMTKNLEDALTSMEENLAGMRVEE